MAGITYLQPDGWKRGERNLSGLLILLAKRGRAKDDRKMKTEEEINRGVPLDRTEEAKLLLFEYRVRAAIVNHWRGN